jgi:predicted dehydrogenase
MIELARGEHLGEVRAVNINGWHHHPDIPDWWLTVDDGGGILHRAGVHDIDFCNAMLGDPTWVDASAGRQVRDASQFPDVMWLAIGYSSGAVAGLQVGLWFAPTHARESFSVQVLGTAGAAVLESSLDAGQLIRWGDDPTGLRLEQYSDGYDIAYGRELSSFFAWISSGEPPVLTWREGWQTVRVMQAAYESAVDHRRVTLSPLPIDL